ncbi:hypothetical protein [Halegenticoccus soli]|uniref:hypothetical protein n=1 Tax=Halegenticoccus soli TaxID=1985678 RepID=UPI0018ED69AD|nr:hypothetical protein [Halegenticoccus soli]
MTGRPPRLADVRKHARWMAHPDDRILEYLCLRGPRRLFPLHRELAEVATEMDYPRVYLEARLERLTGHGLLDRRPDGNYEITDAGRAYLAGELDAGELRRVDAGDDREERSGGGAGTPTDDREESVGGDRSVDVV